MRWIFTFRIISIQIFKFCGVGCNQQGERELATKLKIIEKKNTTNLKQKCKGKSSVAMDKAVRVLRTGKS